MTILLLALLAALPLQDPPAREKASGFTYVRPKGWNRQELNNGVIAILPPGPDAQQCSLFIFPGQNGEINELVFHNQLFTNLTQGSTLQGKIDRAYRGSWQYSRVKMITAQGQPSWLGVYTTKSDTRLEGIMVVAATEEMFKSHRFAVERMITGIEFSGAKAPPAGGPEWKPAPLPGKDKDVRIVGAWTVARMELVFAAGAGQRQIQTVKVVALFDNKVAAMVDAQSTGNDSTYPAEGLATLDVTNPGPNDRRFGRWSEAGGKIEIQWNQGPADSVERAGEDLKGGGILWSAIKPIDGLRLDAAYARPSDFGLPWTLALRKDGTFDADQVNETIGGKLVNRKMPEMGSGSYEFRKWSLILRFDTGFVQSINIGFDTADPATAKKILVNGYPFEQGGAATAAAPAPALAAGPAGAVVHGLVIPIPPTWVRKDDPSRGVYLAPPPDQNQDFIFFVSPPIPLRGTHWEAHKATLKAALPWAQIDGAGVSISHDPNVPGPFIRSTANGKLPTGLYREIQLWTAIHDGTLEAITIINKYDSNIVWPILKQVTFKNPPRPLERPKVVEAYRKLVRKMYTNPGGAALAYGSIMYDRMWLRSDGTADFTPWHSEGYAVSPYVFKLDPGLLTGLAGSWKTVGDKIQVQRTTDDPPVVYERVDGNLGEWESMPRVDGMKLSGRYSKKSQPGAGVVQYYHWIEFTEDGKFKTDGVLTWIGSRDGDWPKFPDKLSGTYEIRDWTIFFKLDDGRLWTTDFSTIHKDPNDRSAILFRTTVFMKE